MEDPVPQPDEAPGDPILSSEEALGSPSAEQVAETLGDQLLAIHAQSYGRGAERADAHFVGDTVVVVLDGLELLPNEEFLIESGRQEAVRELRRRFQQAIEPTFRAAAERATGRRVTAFMSEAHLLTEPRFAVEIFRLEPRRD